MLATRILATLFLCIFPGTLLLSQTAGMGELDLARISDRQPVPAVMIPASAKSSMQEVTTLLDSGEYLPADQTWLQNNGPLGDPLWFAFRLVNGGQVSIDCLVVVENQRLDNVEVWMTPVDTGNTARQTHYRSGLLVPIDERPVRNPAFLFPASLEPGTSLNVLVRIQSFRNVKTQILVEPTVHRLESGTLPVVLSSAFLGAQVLLIIFNIFMCSLIRRREYVFYIISGVFFCAYGMLTALPASVPALSAWPQLLIHGPYIAYGLGLVCFMEFSRLRLSLPERYKTLNVIILSSYLLFPGTLVLHLMGFGSATILGMVLQICLLSVFVLPAHTWPPADGARGKSPGRTIWMLAAAGSIFLFLDYMGIPGGGYLESGLLHASRITQELSFLLITFQLFREVQGLLRRQTELDEHDRISRAFLSGMSHEMRSPLNGIIGYAQNLDTAMSPHDIAHFRTRIEEEARVLLQKVDRILDVVRCETGKIELNPIRFSPSVMLRQLYSQWEQAAKHKGLELILSIDPALNTLVVADRMRLEQLLSLLLDNALKFTSQGSVRIAGTASQVDTQQITCSFSIEDTGPGISADRMRELFRRTGKSRGLVRMVQPEYQAELGVGLSLAQRLCALLGGSFRVESTEAKGTVFAVNLRMPHVRKDLHSLAHPPHGAVGTREHDRGTGGAESARQHPSGKQRGNQEDLPLFDQAPAKGRNTVPRILVVDDLPTNRQVIGIHLSRTGFVIDEAENGLQALELAQRHTYDLILMDIYMPEMNGFETVRALRKTWSASRLPIIGITASTEEDDLRECISSGMNCFLLKPLSREKLLSIMGNFIHLG